MRIKVLGGFGSESPCCNLSGFLINGRVMVDAGTISTALSVNEQALITHVVLSHAHLDHTKALPFLADNIVGRVEKPVKVVGPESVIDTLREHIFNDKIWPDFTIIPVEKPVLEFQKVEVGAEAQLGDLGFTPVWVTHTVPTAGYIIRENGSYIIYSGDTKATDELWALASRLGSALKAVFIETSFPNRMQNLADISGHLTPQALGEEIKKIRDYKGPVFVYHVKSQYMVDIEREIDALGRKDVIVVHDGMEWEI